MKLAFILVVLVCFLADTEAVVPELPGDLARLQTYLQNQEALLQQVQNELQSQIDKNRQELHNVMGQLDVITKQLHELVKVITSLYGK